MLMGIVDSSVKLLNNLQDLVPVLIQLGLRHNAYKVCTCVYSAYDAYKQFHVARIFVETLVRYYIYVCRVGWKY